MIAALLVIGVSLAPQIQVAPQVRLPQAPLPIWEQLARRYQSVGGALPDSPPLPIRIRSAALPAGHAGLSTPGLIELRPSGAALAHELAHQLLFWACPKAGADELFHEAFAMAAAGELALFEGDGYLGLPPAVRVLRARSLDTRAARRAIARLLMENAAADFPLSLARRVRLCAGAAPWAPVTPEELAEAEGGALADAALVLGRHSGEVLIAEGDVRRALPFGSLLKPFVVAAAAQPPELPPRDGQPEWACGQSLPPKLDAAQALLRSCNGYFLDWAARDPNVASLGAYGPILVALGLPRLPAGMAEAAGLQPSLALSPWAIAQAYRLLAEHRPDLLVILRRNAREGTLAGLPESPALEGVALKTGTVRDARSRPRVGFIVAITGDVVAVRALGGQMPRGFAASMVALLARARSLAGSSAAQVQVFGILPGAPAARCDGVGVSITPAGPVLSKDEQPLSKWTEGGAALCLAQPWRVGGRDYAGVFTRSPPLAAQAAPGTPHTTGQLLARRGSDYLFRTTLLHYAAGVVEAEAAGLSGQPRGALLRVAAHDHGFSRHPGRPVCDTTHCQAFHGTVSPRPEDRDSLGKPALPWKHWLPFSAGGHSPWSQARALAEVEAALGAGFSGLHFDAGHALFTRPLTDGQEVYDLPESLPCESLRATLRLPSCPDSAKRESNQILFHGRGRGHGQGLDVEAASRSTLDQDAILRRAYGQQEDLRASAPPR